MVSVSEQLAQQRQQLGQAQAQVTTAEKRLQQQRQILSGQQAQLQPTGLDITRQQQLASLTGRGGVTQLFKQQEAGKKIQLGKVSQAQEQLREFGGRISVRKGELSGFEAGLTRESDIQKGFELARRGKSFVKLESSAQKLGFQLGQQAVNLEKLRASELAQLQLQTPSIAREGEPGFIGPIQFAKEGQRGFIGPIQLPQTSPDFLTPSTTSQKFPELFAKQEALSPMPQPSMVSAFEREPGPSGFLREVIISGETAGLRGEITPTERVKLGLASTALFFTELPSQTIQFGRAIITDPIGTIKETPRGAVEFLGGLGSQLASPTPEVAVGRIVGEIILFKGTGAIPKVVTKGTDIFRTRGLKELPVVDIIAPEIKLGQVFPKISKGQTAQQFLEEFAPLLPGETAPAGFTAAPRPFAKITTAQIGGSEFPGVFQAPKVSPFFLRIAGETDSKLFSLDIFDTLRPSVVRITPGEIKLVPGIETKFPSGGFSKRGVPVTPEAKRIVEFFETAPKGKSFIPFTKAEKEAIIPFGTPLEFTDKRFFFKFEGRRVPIFEFKTGKALGKIDDFKAPPTIESVTSSFGRPISRPGKITPLSSFPSSALISRDFGSPVISRGRGKQIGKVRRGELDFVDRPSRGGGGVSSFGSFGGISSRGDFGIDVFRGTPGISRPAIPTLDFETPAQRPLKKRKSEDKKKKKEKIKDIKKRRKDIRPSFTAITLGIETGLPKETILGGIAPFDIRGLAIRKRSKKKK